MIYNKHNQQWYILEIGNMPDPEAYLAVKGRVLTRRNPIDDLKTYDADLEVRLLSLGMMLEERGSEIPKGLCDLIPYTSTMTIELSKNYANGLAAKYMKKR